MRTTSNEEFRKIVYSMNDSLIYECDLLGNSSENYFVLKVKNYKGNSKVLKGALFNDLPAKIIKDEIQSLQRLRGVSGIAHLEKTYFIKNYLVLMKEFVEGDSPFKGIKEIPVRKKLKAIVKEVHKKGIASIDIKPSNLKINGKKPVIIDMDSYMSKGRNYLPWEVFCNHDWKHLEQVFNGTHWEKS